MPVDWEAVATLVSPLLDGAECGPAGSARMARNAVWLGDGLSPFVEDQARLLAWFCGVKELAAEPSHRRLWVKPLRQAGVPLEDQVWLWLALARFQRMPESNEEKAAHDAWTLEQVGALGMARALARAGRDGVPPLDALSRFYARMGEMVFLTPAGRRIGIRRMVVARRFIKEIEEEEGSGGGGQA